MLFLYLLFIFVILLKKYLNYQEAKNTSVYHPPKKDIDIYGTDAYHDQYSRDYFDLLVRCLIFCSYDAKKFSSIEEYFSLGEINDDLTRIFEEEKIEIIFRNKLIDCSLLPKLLNFKEITSKITEKEWLFELVDLAHDERWKTINRVSEELLTEMNVKERGYDFGLYKRQ